MPTIDVTIENKVYHVDIPWLSLKPLPVVVDGQPYEVTIGGEQGVELQEMSSNWHAYKKPVMAEWHASLRAE